MCKGGRCMYSCGRKKDDFNDLVGGCPYYNNVGDNLFCSKDDIELEVKDCENVGADDDDSYLPGDKGTYG